MDYMASQTKRMMKKLLTHVDPASDISSNIDIPMSKL
jgi:hypothetical protein